MNFLQENEGSTYGTKEVSQLLWNQNRKRHHPPRSLSPGNGVTNGITAEKKKKQLIEKKVKKECGRNRGQTRANRRTPTGWKELQCCVEIRSLVQMCLVLPSGPDHSTDNRVRASTRTSVNFFLLLWRIDRLLALAMLLKLPL